MYVLYVCLYVLIYKCYIFVCYYLQTVVTPVSHDVICCCSMSSEYVHIGGYRGESNLSPNIQEMLKHECGV